MGSLFREFVIGADSFGQLSSGIPNRILSGLMYWLIVAIVMGILFIITGLLIVGIGYQVGKIYRKYCWDILSIIVAITSAAIVIYFGEWIKSVIPVNLITLLLLVHVIYIGIRCYVKDWQEERGILLRVGRTAKFLKLSDLCIKIKFIRLDITLLVLL